ncbi:MAG: HD domain-containing protein [Lentisphaerae bacterium]|nr:HD domain-containing protein [Lentisphaerota bacterium]
MYLLSDVLAVSIPQLRSQRLHPVTVAVIDSGVDSSHEALRKKVVGAWEFTESDDGGVNCRKLPEKSNNDDAGHGTAVASIISRIAPNARILDFKVLSAGFAGSGKVMLKGLEAAIESEAKIINMSLACLVKYRSELEDLLEKAYLRHKIIIASKRNIPKPGDLGFPAELSSCIAVDNYSFDTPFLIRHTGEQPIEFAAHGENVLSAKHGGGYYRLTGTSFATPTVSGVTALLLGRFPELELFEIKSVLKYHSDRNTYKSTKEVNPLEIGGVERDRTRALGCVCGKCGEFFAVNEAFSYACCPECGHTTPLIFALDKKLCKEVLDHLEFNLPEKCLYHNKRHTREVVANVHAFASRYNSISRRKMRCLMTAALLHDVGYTVQYDDNEPLAVEYAQKILPGYGYSAKDIELICRLILATTMPVKPQDLLEKIICDADVGHIGLANYYERSRLLREELENYGIVRNDREFLENEAEFLRGHRFFQPFLEKERKEARKKTLRTIELLLAALKSK